MVEVTQADRNAAKNMDRQNLLGCYLEEHIDRGDYDHVPAIQQFATHRIEAAQAERDRLREVADELELALNAPSWSMALTHVHNAVASLADALGSQP